MKREASNQLAKMTERKPEIASVVTPIVSDGDLQLDFTKNLAQPLGLLVSRKLLCIASPVFKAMLGDDSRFSESTTKTLNPNGVQVVRLGDDNYTMMEIIMNVIHFQGRKVPPTLLFPQFDICARLCDKYDMAESLGHWTGIWSKSYLPNVELPDYRRWLFISTVFNLKEAHAASTRHIVLNATLFDPEELMYHGDTQFSEGVPATFLG